MNEINQKNVLKSWSLPPLYKRSKTGKIMIWEISFDEKELSMKHGVIDGKIVTDKTSIEINQSGRSIQEQAMIEAHHRFDSKMKKGYSEKKNVSEESTKILLPLEAMKGKEYKEG